MPDPRQPSRFSIGVPQHDTSPSEPFTTMISVSHCGHRSRFPGAVGMAPGYRKCPESLPVEGCSEVRRIACAAVNGDDPRDIVVEHDGLRIHALDWGGDGLTLLLQHPNGFCAGFFDPLARVLRDQFRVIGVDARGHGDSDRPDDVVACTFPAARDDVLAVLDALKIDELV